MSHYGKYTDFNDHIIEKQHFEGASESATQVNIMEVYTDSFLPEASGRKNTSSKNYYTGHQNNNTSLKLLQKCFRNLYSHISKSAFCAKLANFFPGKFNIWSPRAAEARQLPQSPGKRSRSLSLSLHS